MAKNTLLSDLAARINSGLTRTSIKTAVDWAEQYRVIKGEKWSFKEFPWLIEPHLSEATETVVKKGAQLGFTETLLNLVFFYIDIRNKDCLYVLPNKNPDASDFSNGRFAPALEESKHLRNLFTNTDNIGHKRAGSANLYVRGSQSRSGLKSLPITFLVMDEVAEFNQDNIPLAKERTSGQDEEDVSIWMISTPTRAGKGISLYYEDTNQKDFFFKCPCCSKSIQLKFPESLIITAEDENDPRVRDSYYICTECKNTLPNDGKVEYLQKWEYVAKYGDRDKNGYSVSQLYSMKIAGTPANIAKKYLSSLRDPAKETEFYNSTLGQDHAVLGSSVSDEDLVKCIQNGIKNRRGVEKPSGLYTMGVDVGKKIHVHIDRYITVNSSTDLNISSKCFTQHFLTVEQFEDLDQLMLEWNIVSCVIDANPEYRKAIEFANRFPGRVKLCIFNEFVNGRSIIVPANTIDPVVQVNRTAYLDIALGRYKNGSISLPIDINQEYKDHIKEPQKIYKLDKNGNTIARYESGDRKPDHYAFSRCYSEIALGVLKGLGSNIDM